MKKTKKVFYNCMTYDHTKQPKTIITEPSQTKPDLSLTIPEILNRFSSGRKLDVAIYDEYTGDGDHLTGVDIRTMDLSEVHELLSVTRDNVRKLQHEANLRHQQKLQADYDAKVIEKHEARRQQNKPVEIPPNKFLQLELPIESKKPEDGA